MARSLRSPLGARSLAPSRVARRSFVRFFFRSLLRFRSFVFDFSFARSFPRCSLPNRVAVLSELVRLVPPPLRATSPSLPQLAVSPKVCTVRHVSNPRRYAATCPTSPLGACRLRTWRALKLLGQAPTHPRCASLAHAQGGAAGREAHTADRQLLWRLRPPSRAAIVPARPA